MMETQKKFLCFIVEGHNDELEITAMLKTPYFAAYAEKYRPAFITMNCDLTADRRYTAQNVRKKLNAEVLSWRKSGNGMFNPIKTSDIKEIIQVVDLDGTFVPDEHVVQDTSFGKVFYDSDCIRCYEKGDIVGRNRKKAAILNELLMIDTIDNVPYSVYYAGCNMDHVLSGIQNPEQRYKNRYSMNFAKLCCSNSSILENSIFNPKVCAAGSYMESWVEIQQGDNSLARRTNFNLFFGPNAKNPK